MQEATTVFMVTCLFVDNKQPQRMLAMQWTSDDSFTCTALYSTVITI